MTYIDQFFINTEDYTILLDLFGIYKLRLEKTVSHLSNRRIAAHPNFAPDIQEGKISKNNVGR